MVAYLRDIWNCRFFWLSLVKTDLRARYRGSVLGMGWSLLHPIAMTTIICIAFANLVHKPIAEFASYLMAGLTFWNYLGTVTVGGCQAFFQGEAYIRQHPAPMAVYPLRTTLGGAFHYSFGLGLVVLLGGLTHGYDGVWPLLSLVPTALLLLLFGWGLAILCAVVNVRFRDTHHLAEIGLQLLFYLTPVMYPAEILEKGGVGFLLLINPLVPLLELLRQPLAQGHVPDPLTYLVAAAITLTVCAGAGLALRGQERQLIFHM
jgi:lipopolysaccharide transport system permease protein